MFGAKGHEGHGKFRTLQNEELGNLSKFCNIRWVGRVARIV
jgi:hypothetical protein